MASRAELQRLRAEIERRCGAAGTCRCRAWPPVVLAYADDAESEGLVEGRCSSCGLTLPAQVTVVQLDPEDRDM